MTKRRTSSELIRCPCAKGDQYIVGMVSDHLVECFRHAEVRPRSSS
jgi:hypothetical protein